MLVTASLAGQTQLLSETSLLRPISCPTSLTGDDAAGTAYTIAQSGHHDLLMLLGDASATLVELLFVPASRTAGAMLALSAIGVRNAWIFVERLITPEESP